MANKQSKKLKNLLLGVAQMIKAFRISKGMTQEQVATKAGIFRQQYGRIEQGKYNFTLRTLLDIASAMDAKVEIKLIDTKGE